ncbi:hypothetical protein HOH87_00195 [bacterium]|nr:hypothetical protein [bacterium]
MLTKKITKKAAGWISGVLLILFLGCPIVCVGDSLLSLIPEVTAITLTSHCHTETAPTESDASPLSGHCSGEDASDALVICSGEKAQSKLELITIPFELNDVSAELLVVSDDPKGNGLNESGYNIVETIFRQEFNILAYSAHAPPIA